MISLDFVYALTKIYFLLNISKGHTNFEMLFKHSNVSWMKIFVYKIYVFTISIDILIYFNG